MTRRLMLGLGVLTFLALILEQGFRLGATAELWIHGLEAGLAIVYVTDRVLLLWRAPRRLLVLRQRKIEYGVLILFIGLTSSVLLSEPMVAGLLLFLHRSTSVSLVFDLVKLFLLANVLIQALRLQQLILVKGLRPEWILIGSFAMLIAAGTLLLVLPRASTMPQKPIRLLDAFFTATSASCVTGLVVRDTGTEFTPLGQLVIVGLMQIGGLGIMTFVAFLAVTSAESLSMTHTQVFQQILSARNRGGLKRQVWAVILFTALVELVGAFFLFAFLPADQDPLARAGWSVFHAVSAFCNAGFSLQGNSLISFQAQAGIMLTFMGLIILGGLGFLVVTDLLGIRVTRLPLIRRLPAMARFNQRVPVYRLPVQTRLSVIVTLPLIAVGLVGFWLLEARHVLEDKPLADRFWIAAFQSVTSRTAGFNTVPIDQLQPATLILLIALMVVGACPVSTGGGIKTVTLGVLLLALRTLITGRERVEVFGRALPQKVLFAALGVTVLYTLVAGLCIFGLAIFDPQMSFRSQVFEVISALSTVGLSTGITPQLSAGSKLILCAAMFVGRVGPISLVLSVFRSAPPVRYQYPEEDLVVG